jgi:cation diffusion facilitator CzcD-associated flavoprotein CzcO
MGLEDFVIYEAQDDVGGTWLRNTYPGLHCDIPSHIYCYSFEPNPDFSMVYSGQAEIQAYIRACAEKHRILDHVRFDTRVEKACFDEKNGSWRIETASGERDRHRVLVAATGGLTEPHYPRIPGRERYGGLAWHSGAWRHDVDLSGRRVAVIGSAASAVQIVPEVAKHAREVTVFSRTPNWVTPRNNAYYSEDERNALRSTENWHRLRWRQYRHSLLWHRAFLNHRAALDKLRRQVLDAMHAAIDDPGLIDALTPDYEPGCKRILVSDDYYPALAEPHVHLVPHGVVEMNESELIANDGKAYPADIAIFCTGYKLGGRSDGRPALEVYAGDGRRLDEVLAARPEAYRGVALPGFPNYFIVCGVNGAAAHGPVFLSAELGTGYIARWVQRVFDDGLRSVAVRPAATRRYNDRIQSELQQMSWAGDCPGWYRDKAGRITPFHPGTIARMRREFRDLHEADFILEPDCAGARSNSNRI